MPACARGARPSRDRRAPRGARARREWMRWRGSWTERGRDAQQGRPQRAARRLRRAVEFVLQLAASETYADKLGGLCGRGAFFRARLCPCPPSSALTLSNSRFAVPFLRHPFAMAASLARSLLRRTPRGLEARALATPFAAAAGTPSAASATSMAPGSGRVATFASGGVQPVASMSPEKMQKGA